MGIHSLQQMVLHRRKSSTSFGHFWPDGSLDIPRKQHRREEEKIRNLFKKSEGRGYSKATVIQGKRKFNGCEAS